MTGKVKLKLLPSAGGCNNIQHASGQLQPKSSLQWPVKLFFLTLFGFSKSYYHCFYYVRAWCSKNNTSVSNFVLGREGRGRQKRKKRKKMTDTQCPCLRSFLWDFPIYHDEPDDGMLSHLLRSRLTSFRLNNSQSQNHSAEGMPEEHSPDVNDTDRSLHSPSLWHLPHLFLVLKACPKTTRTT